MSGIGHVSFAKAITVQSKHNIARQQNMVQNQKKIYITPLHIYSDYVNAEEFLKALTCPSLTCPPV